jgi:hypothetical protein
MSGLSRLYHAWRKIREGGYFSIANVPEPSGILAREIFAAPTNTAYHLVVHTAPNRTFMLDSQAPAQEERILVRHPWASKVRHRR